MRIVKWAYEKIKKKEAPYYYNYSIWKIICKPITPPTLGVNVFYETYKKDFKIHVPTAALETYNSKWAAYKDYIVDGGF